MLSPLLFCGVKSYGKTSTKKMIINYVMRHIKIKKALNNWGLKGMNQAVFSRILELLK